MLEPLDGKLPDIARELPSKQQAEELLAKVHAEARQTRTTTTVERRRKAIGIPAKFEGSTLANWPASTPEQLRVLKLLQRYVDHFADVRQKGASLLFRGNIGAGKSTLGCALCSAVVDRGYSAMYVRRIGAYFREMREAFRRDAASLASDVQGALVDPDLLVLDELGVQFKTEAEVLMLAEVIDDRYGERKPTVLITNLPSAKLDDLVDARTADRLREHGLEVVFNWPSFRTAGGRGSQP